MYKIDINDLPKISLLDNLSLPSKVNYIGCAGFEDRATTILDYLLLKNIQIDEAIGIKYRPYNNKNKVNRLKIKVEKLNGKIKWRIYHRYNPMDFERKIYKLFNWTECDNLIVDISGMSKMLILLLLQNIKEYYHNNLFIVYSEALIYHPTSEEYECAINKSIPKLPLFLTSDIYRVITSPSLSSVSMQGYPILLIAFSTFNYLELITLFYEMNPHKMILIEGDPLNQKDKWRLKAIRYVNKTFIESPEVNVESIILPTFDHILTFTKLQEMYKLYRYTHKIVLAPTGSKLQTISCSIFKQLYPDVQIIYPVTRAYIGEYSEGCKRLWGINYTNYNNAS